MSKKNYEPIRDYISSEDFLDKAGYRRYKPKVGILGKALIEASKHQGRSSFLNRMLDVYFKKLRQQKKAKLCKANVNDSERRPEGCEVNMNNSSSEVNNLTEHSNFKTDRRGKDNSVIQKQNSRHHLQSDVTDNSKTSVQCSTESDGCTANG